MVDGIRKHTGFDFNIMPHDADWMVKAFLGGIGEKQHRQTIYVFVARFLKTALAKRAKLLDFFRSLDKTARQEELDSALRFLGIGW